MIRKYSFILFSRIVPGFILIYILVYTILYLTSVHSRVRQWNHDGTKLNDTLVYSAEERDLIRMKSYLQARLAMSVSDSIGLTINLKDSLVQLEMKGVVLRQVYFDRVEMSRFFRSFHPLVYAHHFSRPFTIREIEGSIIKEPVTVMKVPRDSIEAAKNRTEPDLPAVDFVEWHLLLDSTILISIVQSDPYTGKMSWPVRAYRLRRIFKRLSDTNDAILKFRKPIFYPEITLFIPSNEAKSFFRALPPSGQVVLKL